MLASFDMISK